MTNFARSLPHKAINNPSTIQREKEVNIELQHKKWVNQIRNAHGNNRRARMTLTTRLNEYSNLQVAVIGSIATSAAIAATICVLMFLGF